MERLKNAALVFCLFIVLVVIFSSYFRASEAIHSAGLRRMLASQMN
jgi:hypothetical protein